MDSDEIALVFKLMIQFIVIVFDLALILTYYSSKASKNTIFFRLVILIFWSDVFFQTTNVVSYYTN